jgi:hypothetical protein
MKKIISAVAIFIALAIVVLSNIETVKANVPYFQIEKTQPATTTTAFMSPGNATTSIQIVSNQSVGIDSAYVFVQYRASSTGPTLKYRIEHSQDGIDWYGQLVPTNTNATTTTVVGSAAGYNIAFSTSTAPTDGIPGFLNATSSNPRLHGSFSITTPTRYTRVIYFVPAGGGNGALWSSIIGKRQAN